MIRQTESNTKRMYKSFFAFGIFLVTLFILNLLHSYDNITSKQINYQSKSRFNYDPQLLNTSQVFNHTNITREQLGRMGWTILHLMTANYPIDPTQEDQAKIEEFLHLFGYFYPCKECGSHFLELLKNKPVKASSRIELMEYLCDLHNDVNIRLNKSVFNCQLVSLQWGDCGCSLANRSQNVH